MAPRAQKSKKQVARLTDRLPALFTGSLVLALGTLLANAGNYLFTLIMARLLPPATYGDMVALFAVGTIIAVPTAGVVNIVSRDVSRMKAEGRWGGIASYMAGARRQLLLTGVAVVTLFALCIPAISSVLHLPPLPLFVYSLAVACMFLSALNQGTTQGLQRFGVMSVFLTGSVLFKVALGTILVLAGFQLFGVVGSVVLAQVALYLTLTVYLYRVVGSARGSRPWKLLTKDNQLVIGGMLLMFLLINLDLFFAKHYFPADLAGAYAAMAVLGSIIVFSTASVAAVMLPMVSERMTRRQPYGHLALYSLALVYLPGFVIAAAYVLIPSVIVGLLFPAYPQIVPYLGLYGGLSVVLAVMNVLVHYCIAVRDYRFIAVLGLGNMVAIGLMLAFHQSFFRLIAAAITAGIVAVIGLLIVILSRHRGWRLHAA